MNKDKRIKLIFTIFILAVAAVLMAAGSIKIKENADSVNISGSLSGGVEVKYSDITKLELLSSWEKGTRTFGVGTSKISGGSFSNSTAGSYKLYIYNKTNSYIYMEYSGGICVFNASDADATKAVFDRLSAKIA